MFTKCGHPDTKCGEPCFSIYRLWRCTEYMICVQGPFSQCFWNIQFLPHLGEGEKHFSQTSKLLSHKWYNLRWIYQLVFLELYLFSKTRGKQLYNFWNIWFLLLNLSIKHYQWHIVPIAIKIRDFEILNLECQLVQWETKNSTHGSDKMIGWWQWRLWQEG